MSNGGMIINGVAVSTYRANLAAGQGGHERSAEFTDTLVDAGIGRFGSVVVDDLTSVSDYQRNILLDVEGTPAEILAAIDAFKALVLNTDCRVRFDDRPNRLRIGRCARVEPQYPAGPSQGATSCQILLPFTFEPFAYKCTDDGVLDPTRLSLAVGVRRALPMGNAVSHLMITAHGGGASMDGFTALLRDKGGNKVYEMPFTGTVATDYRVVFQSETSQIRLISDTNVAIDAYSLWDRTVTDETNDFPILRPRDAPDRDSVWATLELVAGAGGSPVGTVEYVEAYL